MTGVRVGSARDSPGCATARRSCQTHCRRIQQKEKKKRKIGQEWEVLILLRAAVFSVSALRS